MLVAGAFWIPYAAPQGYALYLPTVAMSLSDLPAEGVRIQDLPSPPDHALFSVKGQGLRILSNGNSPLNTYPRTGVYLPQGLYTFESCFPWLSQIKFIEAVSGAEVTVEYYIGRHN